MYPKFNIWRNLPNFSPGNLSASPSLATIPLFKKSRSWVLPATRRSQSARSSFWSWKNRSGKSSPGMQAQRCRSSLHVCKSADFLVKSLWIHESYWNLLVFLRCSLILHFIWTVGSSSSMVLWKTVLFHFKHPTPPWNPNRRKQSWASPNLREALGAPEGTNWKDFPETFHTGRVTCERTVYHWRSGGACTSGVKLVSRTSNSDSGHLFVGWSGQFGFLGKRRKQRSNNKIIKKDILLSYTCQTCHAAWWSHYIHAPRILPHQDHSNINNWIPQTCPHQHSEKGSLLPSLIAGIV